MDLTLLKQVALAGGLERPVELSSSELARRCKEAPAAVARRVSRLVEDGLLARERRGQTQLLRVTRKGEAALVREFRDYCNVFAAHRHRGVRGRLVSGLGEGQYYISQPGYTRQFTEKLGFEPFPGTLNLHLDRPFVEPSTSVRVEGFQNGRRTFGAVRCYPAVVGDVPAAVIRPERSHYPDDVVEVIAPVNLRLELGLKDGDVVELELR